MEPPSRGPAHYAPVGASSLQPVATQPRRSNHAASLLAVAAVVIIAAAGFGFSTLHAKSAVTTLQTFYSDVFHYQFDSAFSMLCPDKQVSAKPSFDIMRVQLQGFQNANIVIDTSNLHYDLKDNGLTFADVRIHGSLSYQNVPQGQTVPTITIDETDPLALNGVTW